jgi:DNA-binding CsgD family transcriptional regulator
VATVSNEKDQQFTGNLGRVYKAILQSSAKGIRAEEIAKKLSIDRTTVYSHLSSLKLRKLVVSDQGYWKAVAEEQPLEKEIVIELPIPKDQWRQIALLEMMVDECEENGLFGTSKMYKIPLQKLKETRTIRITGKNVDDIDLQKLGNLIQQATKKSSLFTFRGLFRSFKRAKERTSDSSET